MALRAGRVGVNPADVNPIDGHIYGVNYSSDEIIGKWHDGTDLHRAVIIANTPSTAGSPGVIDDSINTTLHSIKSIEGAIESSSNSYSVNTYISSDANVRTYVDNNGVSMYFRGDTFKNKLCTIIVTFTVNEVSTLNEE